MPDDSGARKPSGAWRRERWMRVWLDTESEIEYQ
jgi:hypothetical protein